MMMINEETPNDVNRSPSNRRASSGNQTNPNDLTRGPCGGRGSDGRQQVTGPDGCGEQAPSANNATANNQDQPQNIQPARRKWTKEDNTELWKCYVRSNPDQRGYRKRMVNLWQQRGNTEASEQRLADQQRAIVKRQWLTPTEREEIARKIEELEEIQENQDEDHRNPNSDDPDNNLVTDDINNNTNQEEEQISHTDKLRQYAAQSNNATRLPSLKGCNQFLLKERTSEVNQALSMLETRNITETNGLLYAGARLVTELMGFKVEMTKPKIDKRRKVTPAKRRVTQQILELRKHLAWIEEIINGKLKNKNSKKILEEKYRLTEQGTNAVKEDLKQRIKAKAATIKRFEERNKGYQQNMLFNKNQKRLYDQLRGGSDQTAIPETEPTKRFWENIWSNPVTHRKNAKWLQDLKNEEKDRVKQQEISITTRKVRSQLRKVPNWKAPGPDCV